MNAHLFLNTYQYTISIGVSNIQVVAVQLDDCFHAEKSKITINASHAFIVLAPTHKCASTFSTGSDIKIDLFLHSVMLHLDEYVFLNEYHQDTFTIWAKSDFTSILHHALIIGHIYFTLDKGSVFVFRFKRVMLDYILLGDGITSFIIDSNDAVVHA